MKKVWVIGNNTSPSTNYNDHIIASNFNARNWSVKPLQFERIEVNLDEQLVYENEILTPPDLAIFSQPIFTIPNNSFYEDVNRKLEILKQFDTIFINGVDAHCNAANKAMMYGLLTNAVILEQKNCPIPKTQILNADLDDDEKQQIVDSVGGFPVVMKRPLSTGGRGVFFVSSLAEFKEKEIEIRIDIGNTGIIIQEFIDMKGIIFDVRVVGRDVQTRIVLNSPDEDFKPNLSNNKASIAIDTPPMLQEIALNAMEALSLDIGRLDIFYADGEYKICEVNSLGSILGNEMTLNELIGQQIVDYCISKTQ